MSASNRRVVRDGVDVNGAKIEMRYAEFGKGRAKMRSWEIFRDDKKIGYAATDGDADVNFDRAIQGGTRSPETGTWE